jgi:hypothetical protein
MLALLLHDSMIRLVIAAGPGKAINLAYCSRIHDRVLVQLVGPALVGLSSCLC